MTAHVINTTWISLYQNQNAIDFTQAQDAKKKAQMENLVEDEDDETEEKTCNLKDQLQRYQKHDSKDKKETLCNIKPNDVNESCQCLTKMQGCLSQSINIKIDYCWKREICNLSQEVSTNKTSKDESQI